MSTRCNCRGTIPASISSPRPSPAARTSFRCRLPRRSPTISTLPRYYDLISGGFAISRHRGEHRRQPRLAQRPEDQFDHRLRQRRGRRVNVAQLTSDATAIGKLTNANATPYQLAISDTAANVLAGAGDAGDQRRAYRLDHRRPADPSASIYRRSRPIRPRSTRSSAASRSRICAANISSALNTLRDANIQSITISGNCSRPLLRI